MSKKILSTSIPFVIFFLILALPSSCFAMPGLTVVEQRAIAVFFLAALCWVLEPVPIYATSVLVIVLELVMMSNSGLILFTKSHDPETLGKLLSYSQVMATMANPQVLLMMGGFFLALAATKYRLDVNLARVMLKPFGSKPSRVLLGLMLITAVFSMFMSNTATTAMMLAMLNPVLEALDPDDPGRVSYVLAIPVAANIGGIGTPIGTPPNAIGLAYIHQIQEISFGGWMAFAVPFMLLLLLLSWRLLLFFFPIRQQSIILNIKGKFMKGVKANIVYLTFAATVLLWMFGGSHGMNSNVVALIPVAVFTCTSIINKEDLKAISWDVLWLVAGGIALGMALEQTGLAGRLVNSIPFQNFPPMAVLVLASFMTLAMANFMSHTATANLLLPLMAVLAGAMTGLDALGGGVGLLLAVTFAASLGMSLPISTPPNALAYATGLVNTPYMVKIGATMGLVGVLLSLGLLWIMNLVGII